MCPLCRAVWAGCSEEEQKEEKEAGEGHSGTPCPTPEVRQEGGGGASLETNRLETFQQKKERWKEVRL